MESGIFVSKKKDVDYQFVSEQDLHEFLAIQLEKLDSLADQLNVERLSSFVDEHELEAAYFDEFHPGEKTPDNWLATHQQWFDPNEAMKSVQKIIDYLQQGQPSEIDNKCYENIIADLKDCLRLLKIIQSEGDSFNFSPHVG